MAIMLTLTDCLPQHAPVRTSATSANMGAKTLVLCTSTEWSSHTGCNLEEVREVTLAEGLCDREVVQVMHPHNLFIPWNFTYNWRKSWKTIRINFLSNKMPLHIQHSSSIVQDMLVYYTIVRSFFMFTIYVHVKSRTFWTWYWCTCTLNIRFKLYSSQSEISLVKTVFTQTFQ